MITIAYAGYMLTWFVCCHLVDLHLLTRMHPSGVTSNGLRFCLVCINLSSTITWLGEAFSLLRSCAHIHLSAQVRSREKKNLAHAWAWKWIGVGVLPRGRANFQPGTKERPKLRRYANFQRWIKVDLKEPEAVNYLVITYKMIGTPP